MKKVVPIAMPVFLFLVAYFTFLHFDKNSISFNFATPNLFYENLSGNINIMPQSHAQIFDNHTPTKFIVNSQKLTDLKYLNLKNFKSIYNFGFSNTNSKTGWEISELKQFLTNIKEKRKAELSQTRTESETGLVVTSAALDKLSCNFNGQTVLHGDSVTAYLFKIAPHNSRCVFEKRVCNNGSLSGSYKYKNCYTTANNNEIIADYLMEDGCIKLSKGRASSLLSFACPGVIGKKTKGYLKFDWQYNDKTDSIGAQALFSYRNKNSIYGDVVVTLWDFGNRNRDFFTYDGVRGDGLSVVTIDSNVIGSLLTVDVKKGLQYFVNKSSCYGKKTIPGWPFFLKKNYSQGSYFNEIKISADKNKKCFPSYTKAHTRWYKYSFRPMKSTNSLSQVVLDSIVTEHYAGKDLNSLTAMERMYFTKELGRTRWEAWKNLNMFDNEKRDFFIKKAKRLTNSKRCIKNNLIPQQKGEWIMVDCREWTNLKPVNKSYDAWINSIKQFYSDLREVI